MKNVVPFTFSKGLFGSLTGLMLEKRRCFSRTSGDNAKSCKELLKRIGDRIREERENSDKVSICLPVISKQIAVYVRTEEKLSTNLEHAIIRRG